MWSHSWEKASSITVRFYHLLVIETYERKGKLYKKRLYTDKFKER